MMCLTSHAFGHAIFHTVCGASLSLSLSRLVMALLAPFSLSRHFWCSHMFSSVHFALVILLFVVVVVAAVASSDLSISVPLCFIVSVLFLCVLLVLLCLLAGLASRIARTLKVLAWVGAHRLRCRAG